MQEQNNQYRHRAKAKQKILFWMPLADKHRTADAWVKNSSKWIFHLLQSETLLWTCAHCKDWIAPNSQERKDWGWKEGKEKSCAITKFSPLITINDRDKRPAHKTQVKCHLKSTGILQDSSAFPLPWPTQWDSLMHDSMLANKTVGNTSFRDHGMEIQRSNSRQLTHGCEHLKSWPVHLVSNLLEAIRLKTILKVELN